MTVEGPAWLATQGGGCSILLGEVAGRGVHWSAQLGLALAKESPPWAWSGCRALGTQAQEMGERLGVLGWLLVPRALAQDGSQQERWKVRPCVRQEQGLSHRGNRLRELPAASVLKCTFTSAFSVPGASDLREPEPIGGRSPTTAGTGPLGSRGQLRGRLHVQPR